MGELIFGSALLAERNTKNVEEYFTLKSSNYRAFVESIGDEAMSDVLDFVNPENSEKRKYKH